MGSTIIEIFLTTLTPILLIKRFVILFFPHLLHCLSISWFLCLHQSISLMSSQCQSLLGLTVTLLVVLLLWCVIVVFTHFSHSLLMNFISLMTTHVYIRVSIIYMQMIALLHLHLLQGTIKCLGMTIKMCETEFEWVRIAATSKPFPIHKQYEIEMCPYSIQLFGII